MTRPYTRRSPRPEKQTYDATKQSSIDAESLLMAEDTRPDMRRDMRTEDPRAAAAARAKELLEHGVLDVDTADRFRVDRAVIPDGWDYEWKRYSVFNEVDPAYQVNLSETGWEPVPLSRHPEFMPKDHTGKVIERDGMVLMERPKVVSDMVRERDHRNALKPVREMEAKLAGAAPGQFDRVDANGRSTVKLNKSYGPVPIPE